MLTRSCVNLRVEGPAEYTTCAGLLEASSAVWPKTALFEIADAGIPLSKLAIGKPARRELVNDGYMSAATLAGCVAEAMDWGWGACPACMVARAR